MFHLWCTGVAILDLCFKGPHWWSLNIHIVSITRWQMHSPNWDWNWIWELLHSQNLWMEWLWIKAIFISFRVAEYLLLFQLGYRCGLIISFCSTIESFLPTCIALICYVWSSSSNTQFYLTCFNRDDEKSLLGLDFIYCICCFVLSFLVVDGGSEFGQSSCRFVLMYLLLCFVKMLALKSGSHHADM